MYNNIYITIETFQLLILCRYWQPFKLSCPAVYHTMPSGQDIN